MNLQHVRTFLRIAAEGSVTRAARRARISQPALSKQVAELEEALGVVLFDRLPRGVRLTEAGEVLRRHAERIFASEAAAEAELAELRGLLRGRLSVGASTTIGSYLIPTVFGAFNRAHPTIRLELEIDNTAAVQARVLEGVLDLGLTEGFVSSEQLCAEEIHQDEMVVIAAPSHPFCHKSTLRCRDLSRVPFISRERGSGTRDVIEAALHERGVSLEPVMALGSTEAVKKAVAAGMGVAIVSRLALDLELAAGSLAVVQVLDLQVRRALHLVRLKGKRDSALVEAFLPHLRAALG